MRSGRSFAAFILTHGRPHDVITFTTLRASGYTGRIILLVDNEDESAPIYCEKFGVENVIIFDKAVIAQTFDTGDNTSERRASVFARNASLHIAHDLGLDYFVQLDDDYKQFEYRHKNKGVLLTTPVSSMDAVCDAMLDFLDDTGVLTVAFSQGGDHLGGASTFDKLKVKRKAMNSFFFKRTNGVQFVGRLNEDVNTYVTHGARGSLFLTLLRLQLVQGKTQDTPGGLSELYRDTGTYLKSFFTVMMAPSCTKIVMMGQTHQ
jgi:hypothetical protein